MPAEARAWWSDRVNDARALLDLLDRRATALCRIATALTELQADFIRDGETAHRPLTRTELAARLSLHPSTVSRAVQNAVAALPGHRTLPLSAFFGGAVAARDQLARLLAADSAPNSDAETVERLAELGFDVARRTVAKYRLQLSAAGTLLRTQRD